MNDELQVKIFFNQVSHSEYYMNQTDLKAKLCQDYYVYYRDSSQYRNVIAV